MGNRWIAIILPSFVFSLLHIPSMQSFSAIGVCLLILSGTLVGIMFSLVTYAGKSISNSVLLHAIWNFVMITGILEITSSQKLDEAVLFSIRISTESPLITGAGFGVEASIISIIGYALVCIVTGIMWKRNAGK